MVWNLLFLCLNKKIKNLKKKNTLNYFFNSFKNWIEKRKKVNNGHCKEK